MFGSERSLARSRCCYEPGKRRSGHQPPENGLSDVRQFKRSSAEIRSMRALRSLPPPLIAGAAV